MPTTKEQISVDANEPQVYLEVNGGLVFSAPPKSSFTETLEKVLKELKELQEQSQGRIRMQYAVSVKEQYFDVIGRIKDFDTEAGDTLYGSLSEWEEQFEPFGWEVRLIVVAEHDTFTSDYELTDV